MEKLDSKYTFSPSISYRVRDEEIYTLNTLYLSLSKFLPVHNS